MATLLDQTNWVTSCEWSPDGRIVLGSGDEAVTWDIASGKLVATLGGKEARTDLPTQSADARRTPFVSCGALFFCDAETGQKLGMEMHHFKSERSGPSWATIDRDQNRILACDKEASRFLGWVVPEEGTCLPAETYGPLPVKDYAHRAGK